MMTLRCTARVRAKLHAVPSSVAVTTTTRLGDWYAGWLPARRPRVVFLNERTLLAVLVAAAPGGSLLERWLAATHPRLLDLGVPPAEADAETAAVRGPAIGATTDRRVLGCLNEAVRTLRLLGPLSGEAALREAERYLGETPYSLIGDERPVDLVRTVFDVRLPNGPRLH